jgi:hypothetical protein
VVRGLFGLEWDVPQQTLTVTPLLPAEWQSAGIHNLPFGRAHLNLRFTRAANELIVEAENAPTGTILASRAAGAHADGMTLHIPLPDLEVSLPAGELHFGDTTRAPKVLDQEYQPHHLRLVIAGMGGSTCTLILRENARNLRVLAEGATLGDLKEGMRTATLQFPPGDGYQTRPVEFSW